MNNLKNSKKLFTALLGVSTAIAFASTITPVNAFVLPPSIQNEVRSEVGGNIKHSDDMLNFDKERKDVKEGYELYEKTKEQMKEGKTPEIIKNVNVNDDVIKATVEEMDTKGVFINSVEVAASEILTKEEINPIIEKIVGKNVFIKDIQEVVDEINNLYASKGFVTARAYLPEQTVKEGNIYIDLVESRIGKITVEKNRWTKADFITDRLPQKQYQLFDIVELEKDILDFNRYHEGVALSANLKAGEKTGTTDIEIQTKEKFPFHVSGIFDNMGRQSIGKLRGGAMIQADSLFGMRDQMTLGSYFSKSSQTPFFDYNIPVNKYDGRVGFMYSSGFSKITEGSLDWLNIKSKTYTYSLYYSQPIIRKPGFELKGYAAANYKRARTSILNDFMDIGLDEVTSGEVAVNMRKDTKYGIWYASQSAYYAMPIFDKDSNYFKYSGNVIRLHDFSHGVIGQLRSNYQIIPNNKHIPYLDQFQSGGMATVRGYSEGIMLGKNGYYMSGELIFPILPRQITSPRSHEKIPFVGKYVKGAIFADHAGVFPTASEDYYGGSYFLASIGMGFRVQLPGDLSARLYWGYPLINNRNDMDRKIGRFHFELVMSPDFDTLLKTRLAYHDVEEAQKEVKAKEIMNNYDDVRHYDYYEDGNGAL